MHPIANTLRASLRSAVFTALLSLCLLFAQAMGFVHAYAHASLASEPTATLSANDALFDHAKSGSGCASYDAIALAAGLHSADFSLPVAPALPEPILIPLAQSRSLQFSAHFHSRAPPLQA